jgi:hypothetical protein
MKRQKIINAGLCKREANQQKKKELMQRTAYSSFLAVPKYLLQAVSALC